MNINKQISKVIKRIIKVIKQITEVINLWELLSLPFFHRLKIHIQEKNLFFSFQMFSQKDQRRQIFGQCFKKFGDLSNLVLFENGMTQQKVDVVVL